MHAVMLGCGITKHINERVSLVIDVHVKLCPPSLAFLSSLKRIFAVLGKLSATRHI